MEVGTRKEHQISMTESTAIEIFHKVRVPPASV